MAKKPEAGRTEGRFRVCAYTLQVFRTRDATLSVALPWTPALGSRSPPDAWASGREAEASPELG